MGANIYVYCPANEAGLDRNELEECLENFFGTAAEDCGGGSGAAGFNLDYELADGEDARAWADRLKPFLANIGVRIGSSFDVFPDGWQPGTQWRRVDVYGADESRVDNPTRHHA